MLAAAVVLAGLGARQAAAQSPHPDGFADPLAGAYPRAVDYYPYMAGVDYYYNPYVAPYPAYGILPPPPLATVRIVYGKKRANAPTGSTMGCVRHRPVSGGTVREVTRSAGGPETLSVRDRGADGKRARAGERRQDDANRLAALVRDAPVGVG